MIARVPRTVQVGIGLILTAVVWTGGWAWWASAANPLWVPLDVQIPRSSGHLRKPFKIRVKSTYQILILAERRVNSDVGSCATYPLCGDLPRAEWSLSNGKEVIAGGDSLSNGGQVFDTAALWRQLDTFQAAQGNYVVDVDFLGNGNWLRGGAPRLMVVEIGGWRGDAFNQAVDAVLESLLLMVTGIYLMVREAKIQRRERAADLARAYSLTRPGPQARDLRVNEPAAPSPTVETGFHRSASVAVGAIVMLAGCGAYAYVQHWDGDLASALLGLCSIFIGGGASVLAIASAGRFRKQAVPVAPREGQGPPGAHVRWRVRSSKMRPFQGMPSFGLVAFLVYLLVAIPIWLIRPLPPKGLVVHLLRLTPAAPGVPGMDPLLVQVMSNGRDNQHSVSVNWQPVAWADLGAVVQRELKSRPPNWPVYVEGDPNGDWQWVAMAIDTIRGLQGEVYLLTTWKGLPREKLETRVTHKSSSTRSSHKR